MLCWLNYCNSVLSFELLSLWSSKDLPSSIISWSLALSGLSASDILKACAPGAFHMLSQVPASWLQRFAYKALDLYLQSFPMSKPPLLADPFSFFWPWFWSFSYPLRQQLRHLFHTSIPWFPKLGRFAFHCSIGPYAHWYLSIDSIALFISFWPTCPTTLEGPRGQKIACFSALETCASFNTWWSKPECSLYSLTTSFHD